MHPRGVEGPHVEVARDPDFIHLRGALDSVVIQGPFSVGSVAIRWQSSTNSVVSAAQISSTSRLHLAGQSSGIRSVSNMLRPMM